MSNTPPTLSNRTPPYGGDKPLAIYIHWPFCLSKCPYCDFNSHVRDSVAQDRWRAALLKELEYMAHQVGPRRVTSIFFGGGTPSLMPPETVAALIERVKSLWPESDDYEITLEANPTSVEAEKFTALREAGVNRVSLGVQSLRDSELQFLGRGHNVGEALKAIDLARQTFARYSFDLIYARPNQTLADWENELGEALRYTGGHLSLYQLTIEENTAFHHAYKNGKFALPDEETAEALYRLTEDMTGAHGLCAYEVSNYAAPGQESRHNLAYWLGDDYIGVGPGAHGRITRARNPVDSGQWTVDGKKLFTVHCLPSTGAARHATQTLKSPERWLENVEKNGHAVEVWEVTDPKREAEERLMMGLRLKNGIDYEELRERCGIDLRTHINQRKLQLYIDKSLLVDSPNSLTPTLAGRLVLNRLTAELLN